MAGRGRRLSASGVDRGVVVVEGKSYTYAYHSNTWRLIFQPGLGGARDSCARLLNGDFPDEATFARRISAACDRAAAKELAPAQATAVDAPSPLHTRSPSKKRVSELFNVSRDDVPASFRTDRPRRAASRPCPCRTRASSSSRSRSSARTRTKSRRSGSPSPPGSSTARPRAAGASTSRNAAVAALRRRRRRAASRLARARRRPTAAVDTLQWDVLRRKALRHVGAARP
mmetsp:Transcript_23732/g.80122  ORF Transcript_23732/g.80122 Transcript_23732/m.80122 type:complete len:229 (+) Transcript_23732:55-741(+)